MLGRTQGVVHAVAPGRIEADPVGRVGREECRGRASQQASHVLRTRRVAAQEPVVPEHVELAWLDVGRLGWLRDIVGVGPSDLHAREVAQQRGESGVVHGDLGQKGTELLVVVGCHRADRVEGREDERLFLGREVDV